MAVKSSFRKLRNWSWAFSLNYSYCRLCASVLLHYKYNFVCVDDAESQIRIHGSSSSLGRICSRGCRWCRLGCMKLGFLFRQRDLFKSYSLSLSISRNLISKLFWDSELKFGESIYLPSVSVHQSGRYSRRIVLCQFRVPEKQFLNLISN